MCSCHMIIIERVNCDYLMRAFSKIIKTLPFFATSFWLSRRIKLEEDNADENNHFHLKIDTFQESMINQVVELVNHKNDEEKGEQIEENIRKQKVDKRQQKGDKPQQKRETQQSKEKDERQKFQQKKQQTKEEETSFTQKPFNPQNQQTKQSQPKIQDLKQNQVLIGTNCPQYLRQYLKKSGLTLIPTKNQSYQIIIKNVNNSTKTFTSNSDTNITLKYIANFIQPPSQLKTVSEAEEYVDIVDPHHFTIFSYIPSASDYQEYVQKTVKSEYDTFSKSRIIDIQQKEKEFMETAYNSSSHSNNFAIVRTPQVAQFLKLNKQRIGEPYIMTHSLQQANLLHNKKKLKIKELKKYDKFNTKEQLSKLTHSDLTKINSEQQLQNKLEQMKMSGDTRKILCFYSDQSRQQFVDRTEHILQKVANIQKQFVVVLKSNNLKVIRNVLHIQPDSFATVRLVDIYSHQQPLFQRSKGSNRYCRSQFKGPFQVQQLCRFVASQRWEEHYQNKRNVPLIKPITPKQLQNRSNTVVMLEKEGCQGCKYLGESMQQIKKIIKRLRNKGKARQQCIYRYGIVNPILLANTEIRRYSIFNDNPQLPVPDSTPKLYLFSQGNHSDLQVHKSLQKLASTNPSQADEAVIIDIIQKIQKNQHSLQQQ